MGQINYSILQANVKCHMTFLGLMKCNINSFIIVFEYVMCLYVNMRCDCVMWFIRVMCSCFIWYNVKWLYYIWLCVAMMLYVIMWSDYVICDVIFMWYSFASLFLILEYFPIQWWCWLMYDNSNNLHDIFDYFLLAFILLWVFCINIRMINIVSDDVLIFLPFT